VAIAAALLFSCGEPSGLPPELAGVRPSGVRVLLVGIDGATFNVIEPLLERGELPVLAGLMARGSHARLRSESPMKSPAIWTTVATGHPREVHGIDDFTSSARGTSSDPAMVASVDRRTLALWNILTAFGLESTVVGWWVTWPAEPILGRMVSDRLAQSRWASWTGAEREVGLTFPEGLADELAGLVVDPLEPPLAELEALVALSEGERAELLAAREPIPFHGPSVLKFGYCEQRTYENVAFELLRRRQGDLALVFLIAVDPISHTYWHFFEPQAFGGGVDPEEAARLGPIVPAIYAHNDRTLGRMLELVDEDTVVLIVSDHGFKASGELPVTTQTADLSVFGIDKQTPLERPVNVGMTGVHKENGVLVAAGGPILAGAVFQEQPTVADIAPTVLGRVLEEMIDPEFLRAHPLRSIASYEGLIERPELAVGAQQDGLRKSYLKALGYTD
jgi:hypothetical protein